MQWAQPWIWIVAFIAIVIFARRFWIPKKHLRLDRHYPSWVAGLHFPDQNGIDRGLYCAQIKIGDEIKMVREPENPHDPKAVGLWHKSQHIGYIPMKHEWIAEAIDEKRRIGAVAREVLIEDGRASFVGIEVGIAEIE